MTVLLVALLSVPALAGTWCYPSGLRVSLEGRAGRKDIGIASVVGGVATSQVGAAHVVEHLWFRSPQRGEATVGNLLADLGAESNAFTSFDEVSYVTVANRRSIRGLLELEAARIDDPLAGVDEEVIEAEKRVVIAELQERYDGTRGGYSDLLDLLTADDLGYSNGISGSAREIDALTAEAIARHAERVYRPGNVAISIVGDFNDDAMRELFAQTFPLGLLADPRNPQDISPGGCSSRAPKDEPPSPPRPDGSWVHRDADVDEPTGVFGWTLPAGRRELHEADLMGALLEAQSRRRTPLDVQCATTDHATFNTLVCSVPLTNVGRDTGRIDRFVGRIRSLWSGLFIQSSIRHQRLASAASFYARRWRAAELPARERLSADSGGYLAERAIHFFRFNSWVMPLRAKSDVMNVALIAGDLVDSDRMRSMVLMPRRVPSTFGGERHGGRVVDVARTRDPDLVDADYLRRFLVLPDVDDIRVEREASGLEIWFWPSDALAEPRTALTVGYPAFLTDPVLTDSAYEMLANPGRVAADRIGSEVYDDGTEFFWSGTDDTWTVHVQHADVPRAAKILGSVARAQPRLLGPRAVEQRWEALGQRRRQALADASTQASLARWKRFAPELPMGLLDDEVFARAQGVERAEVKELVDDAFRPENARLLIVGPSEPGLLGAASSAFGNWVDHRERHDAGEAGSAPVEISTPDRAVLVLEPVRRRGQADVTVSCHISDSDRTGAWLLERYVSGALNARLRGERALTYGVHSSSRETAHGPTLSISTSVAHGDAGEAVAAVFDALASAVPADRLAQLKVEAARKTVSRYQTGDELLRLLRDLATTDDDDEDGTVAQRLASVTSESLAAVLEPCVGHEVVSIVGDPEVVGPSLRGSAVDFEVIDWR